MKNKKNIRIWGGLGNQLFQYAFGKYLEKKFKIEVSYNISWYNKVNSRKFILDKIINFQNKVIEKEESYFDKLINYKTEKIFKYLVKKNKDLIPKNLIGYWQDLDFAKYIKPSDFKKDFFIQDLKGLDRQYYVLHFRGGDFYNSKEHLVLDLNYYKDAVTFFEDKPIYCVSDDNLKLASIISELNLKNTFQLDLNEIESFKLIFNSSGGIASNSTFCWWASFLSKNDNWVYPKIWLKKKSLVSENLFIENTLLI
jgi:hypothetical protein